MKKIWRKNNSKLSVLDTDKEKSLTDKEMFDLLQADVNSQLMWITVHSCKGIPCKECYISKYCTTKIPADSQSLAGSIIKGAVSK